MPPMPHMEKTNQVLHVWLFRIDIDTVNVNCSQHVFELVKSLCACAAVLVSEFPAGGIDKNNLSGLGICKFN
jgi:hypothetical protein